MNRTRRSSNWRLALLCLLVLPARTLAQETGEVAGTQETGNEEEKKEEKKDTTEARWYGELQDWIAQPLGLEYEPATSGNPIDPFGTKILDVPHGTGNHERVRAGYVLPGELGRVLVTYWSQRDEGELEDFAPSQFIFGQTLTVPFFAGFRDDGRADAFRARTLTKTRDLRLDYYRPVFSGKRIEGWWFIGLRRVSHDRNVRADYFALVPDLPPLLPPATPQPRPDLEPLPDRADLSSSFSGRGVGTGLEVLLPVGRKVKIETGASFAVLRGKMSTAYASQTHFYGLLSGDRITQIYDYPFDEFEDPTPETPEIDDPTPLSGTRQVTVPLGIASQSVAASATVFEAYIGVRWTVWRNLEILGGFRQSRYENVGTDLRPKSVSVSSNGTLNLEDVSRTDHSVGYEGYYLGVAYRY